MASPLHSILTTLVCRKDYFGKIDDDRGVAVSFLERQQIRWKLLNKTVEFQKGKKCSMKPLAGKIEQDLFHLHN